MDDGGSKPAADADTTGASADEHRPPRVVAGERHACALLAGLVCCWGENAHGQLGVATSDYLEEARLAIHDTQMEMVAYSAHARRLDLANVTQIVAGRFDGCALSVAGAVDCWGANMRSKAEDDPGRDTLAPVRIENVPPITQLTSSSGPTCALSSYGTVYCSCYAAWFRRFGGIDDVARVTVGPVNMYFIRRDGTLRWRGQNPT